MSRRLREVLSELSDASRYVRVPGVTVFDEHTERYWEDAEGNPCREGKRGAKERVRKFDRGKLEEIARRCNERYRTGNLAPLTFGHTVSGEDDESKQPRPVGYAARYSVAYDPDLKRHVIRTDFYVRRSEFDQAKTYPRVSIELWPKQGIIDPIALLRRTPQRDLGQWCFNADGESVLRYQRENPMTKSRRYAAEDEDLFDDGPPGGGDDMQAPPGGGEEDTDEMAHERYMKHCYGHPDAERSHKYRMQKYGMAEMPGGEGMGGPPGGDDPTDLPSADDGPPMRNGAFPSATNSGAPVKKGRAAAGQEAIKYAKLQREVEQLKHRAAVAEAQAIVTQLVAEDYALDAEAEVKRFARLGEAERQEREDWIRKYGRKAPTGAFGPVARRGEAGGGPVDIDEDPESMPAADQARALQYQREHRLFDLEIAELARRAMPEKYGRNGHARKGGE